MVIIMARAPLLPAEDSGCNEFLQSHGQYRFRMTEVIDEIPKAVNTGEAVAKDEKRPSFAKQ
jgi:hypothetical protein